MRKKINTEELTTEENSSNLAENSNHPTMKIQQKLLAVQSELKAPKGQFNAFGKYKYRSCEDILEAVKPLLSKHGLSMTISDDIVDVGGRVYVKATVQVHFEQQHTMTTAFAREEDVKKGMDASQVTGATSSYARKYALNGMFLIDDTKDSDSTNTHGNDNNVATKPKAAPAAEKPAAPAAAEPAADSATSIMDKAVNYMKSQADRNKAYETVMRHYGEQLTEAQTNALKKFIR
jgi:hypothetical protein